MLRAATLCRRAFAPAIVALALCATTRAGDAPSAAARPDVSLQVVVLSATGRAEKPEFDRRTPLPLRKQIECQNLAYGRYDLLDVHRKDARFGADVNLDLPDKETLVLRPSADEGSPLRIRLGCRILDAEKKAILVNTMRLGYGRSFIIQRSKGPGSGLLIGISAQKPAENAPKP